MILKITTALIEILEASAREAMPEEACGLLLGTAGPREIIIQDCIITQNVTCGDPCTTFEIDPAVHVGLQKAARAGGAGIVGVWHSHPHSPAVLSAADIAQSTEQNWVWIITGFSNGGVKTAAFLSAENDSHDFSQLEIMPT